MISFVFQTRKTFKNMILLYHKLLIIWRLIVCDLTTSILMSSFHHQIYNVSLITSLIHYSFVKNINIIVSNLSSIIPRLFSLDSQPAFKYSLRE